MEEKKTPKEQTHKSNAMQRQTHNKVAAACIWLVYECNSKFFSFTSFFTFRRAHNSPNIIGFSYRHPIKARFLFPFKVSTDITNTVTMWYDLKIDRAEREKKRRIDNKCSDSCFVFENLQFNASTLLNSSAVEKSTSEKKITITERTQTKKNCFSFYLK